MITRTTRTPAFWGYPPPSHDYPYHWVILDPKSKEDKVKVTNLKNSPKFQIFEFRNGHYTRHTFWSCLIRCANMKWIRWVLLKIQSGHDSVHRWTDGQGDTSIPPYQLRWSGGYNNKCRIYVDLSEITNGTVYPNLTGKLWSVFCDYFGEKSSFYKEVWAFCHPGMVKTVAMQSTTETQHHQNYVHGSFKQLTLYVLNFSEGTYTYICILCHFSTLIWHRYLKQFLK